MARERETEREGGMRWVWAIQGFAGAALTPTQRERKREGDERASTWLRCAACREREVQCGAVLRVFGCVGGRVDLGQLRILTEKSGPTPRAAKIGLCVGMLQVRWNSRPRLRVRLGCGAKPGFNAGSPPPPPPPLRSFGPPDPASRCSSTLKSHVGRAPMDKEARHACPPCLPLLCVGRRAASD